jgi:uncharacterized protein
MFKAFVLSLLSVVFVSPLCAAPNRIVTGSERGTYIQIGRDLAKWVAEPAGIPLEAVASKGSSDNIQRLRSEPGVRLALVQSDVYQAFLDEALAGNTDAGNLIRPLKVVMPLYDEEVYFVTRADSPLNYIHEIKDKRINVGLLGSGTALSATTLYRLMFGSSLSEKNTSFLDNEGALLKLATDRTIDVAVIVAGQPAKLFAEMKPEARQYIKLLKFSDQAPEAQAALGTYFAATIRASSYPNWLTADVPTLTTKALLVTYDYKTPEIQQMLGRFARSLCRNFANLKTEGHAKWQEVNMGLPALGKGWSYYKTTEKELVNCNPNNPEAAPTPGEKKGSKASTEVRAACTQGKKVLGLCRQ